MAPNDSFETFSSSFAKPWNPRNIPFGGLQYSYDYDVRGSVDGELLAGVAVELNVRR